MADHEEDDRIASNIAWLVQRGITILVMMCVSVLFARVFDEDLGIHIDVTMRRSLFIHDAFMMAWGAILYRVFSR